jgi:hypothetical protein
METPAPVNVNLLKDILAKSKAIMAKTEEKSPTKKTSRQRVNEDDDDSYRNQPVYDERDEREPEYKTPTLKDYQPNVSQQPKTYTAEQVMASNLPQAIKEAMIKNPIPQLQGPPTPSFKLEDMGGLVEKKPVAKPTRLNESNNGDMITISRSELKELINESITQFFTQAYNKNLTEAAIKKTISTLINEGKLNIKKK